MINSDENHASGDELEMEDGPATEPKSSRYWLACIRDAEKVFEDYQARSDSIDKLYANMARLANIGRDREFQLFWANCEVLKPSIYARSPIPVVVPKFKDRRPLYRVSSELLERCSVVGFDLTDINSVMMLIRDDLTVLARGVAWVRYESKADSGEPTERVCVEHKERKDFLHEPARKWGEVGWVAGAGYLTKKEMRKRFKKTSGDAYQSASFTVMREEREVGGADNKRKAKVWEIWSKDDNKVYWVTEGCDKLLDESEPHLKLEGFFPCPKPAYATVQRGSLMPVPDMLFYKDQLEEINELTGRIHALSESIKVQGFYPSGSGDVADAIEAAVKSTDNRRILVPVSNWAAFGQNGGDPIIWLPIEMVTATVAQLVELRRQIIDDVYQIIGLSDIMRGTTDASETLGAQQLKSQYGSVRIRDKQGELIRIARDLVRIMAEIMAEEFDTQTLLDMSQMEIPTDADIRAQVKPLEQQAKAITEELKQAKTDPEMVAQAQANPEEAQQILGQAQQQVQEIMQQIEKLQEQPTVEKVTKFLKDNRLRPFVLDIETDSTIQPDEQAEKEARTEFTTALAGLVAQFTPVLQANPAMAPMVGGIIKFTLAPFRVGRELEGLIDEAIEGLINQSQQPQTNPEAEAAQAKAQADQASAQASMQMKQMEAQQKQEEWQREQQNREREWQYAREDRQMDAEIKMAQIDADMRYSAQKHSQDMAKGALDIRKAELGIENQQKQAQINAAAKAQDASMRESAAESNESRAERAFERESVE